MKKTFLLLVAALCAAPLAFSQAVLPTTFDFESAPAVPTGWSTNTNSSYGSGVTGRSGKLNQQDNNFTVSFLDEPGLVTYYLRGWTGGSVNVWGGNFELQESTDGNTWSVLRSFNTLDENNYIMYTDQPAATTRYLRWNFTMKISGANVGLDDVTIATPLASPPAEINATFNGSNSPSGSQIAFNSPVNTTTPVSITVENLGTVDALNISNVNITGANASEFVLSASPTTISAQSDDQVVIDFTPTVMGTRTAQLEIASNDISEPNYIINLYGVGGDFASEPASQPSNLNFTNVKSYRVTGSFDPAANTDGFLVIRKKGSAVTSAPADGTTYLPGDMVGDAKVISVGNLTSFWPKNTVAETDYHFAVFGYNGFEGFINYLTDAPLTGMVTSAGPAIGNYYQGLNPSDSSFVADLGNITNPHTAQFYGNYDEIYVGLFGHRDTTNGQKVVTGVYGGEQYVYSDPFDWSYLSREHTFPHSWFPTWPADEPEQPEYNDMHHLFPTQFTNANAVRSNLPLGEVETVTSTYLGSKFGDDINGNRVFEPRDAHKGDAARAIMYMCVTYDVVSIFTDWSLPENISLFVPYGQDQEVLKKWHWEDLPDAWEIARNDFLDSVQGNRNPFVDSVNWVCYIDFSDMSYIGAQDFEAPCPVANSIAENGALQSMKVFPNPSADRFTLTFNLKNYDATTISIYDLQGKQVYTQAMNAVGGFNRLEIAPKLASGMYQLELKGSDFVKHEKIQITK